MINREHYIKPIHGFYEPDLIKIITGIRRCGKSVILEQIMQEVRQKTDNIIYLNFEDKRISANILDENALIEYVDTHRKSGKCYLFLMRFRYLRAGRMLVKHCAFMSTHFSSQVLTLNCFRVNLQRNSAADMFLFV